MGRSGLQGRALDPGVQPECDMSTAVRARASYDLHLHTWWNDDAASDPRCYLQQAAARDMCCLAITEHHNLDSQAEVFAAAAQYPAVRVLRAPS